MTINTPGNYNVLLLQADSYGEIITATSSKGLNKSYNQCEKCSIQVEVNVPSNLPYSEKFLHYVINVKVTNISNYPIDVDFSSYENAMNLMYIQVSPSPDNKVVRAGQSVDFVLWAFPNDIKMDSDCLYITGQYRNSGKICEYWLCYLLEAGTYEGSDSYSGSQLPPKPDETDNGIRFNVFPNPANSNINIDVLLQNTGKVIIYDINGKLMWQKDIKQDVNAQTINVDVAAWAAASYIAVLKNAKDEIVKQQVFIKK
jgi:hypothetical protein